MPVTSTNPRGGDNVGAIAPAVASVAITPSDSDELATVSRGLYVGGSGDAVLKLAKDSATVTFTGLVAGTVYPFQVKQVMATGTTATGLVGLT